MTDEQQIAPNVWSVADRWMTDVLTHDISASVVIMIIILTQLPWWGRLIYVLFRRR